MKQLILVIILISFIQCASKTCDEVEQMAQLANKSERKYLQFRKEVETLKSKTCLPPDLFSKEGKIDSDKLRSYFYNSSHYGNDTIGYTGKELTNFKFNIYLENSASMWPYYNGVTECEAAVSEIIVDAEYLFGENNLSLSFITDTIYPAKVDESFAEFLSKMSKDDFYSYANLSTESFKNTELSEVFKTVMNSTGPNDIGMLITDCIYSLSGKKTEEFQATEWVLIKKAFLDALDQPNFSVLISKYESNYNGAYYYVNKPNKFYIDKNGKKKQVSSIDITGQNRPYYVILLGNKKVIQRVLTDFPIESYPGWQNSYFITNENATNEIAYQILKSDQVGSFKFARNSKKEIENFRASKRGEKEGYFGFDLAINMKGLILKDDYLLDPTNYDLPEHYELDIVPFEHDEYSHKLRLLTNKPRKEELEISLKRTTPSWIEETNSEDDSQMSNEQLNKTVGFKNFIEGIKRAYNTALQKSNKKGLDNFYTIKIKIKD